MGSDKQEYVLFGRVTPENQPLGISNMEFDVTSPFYSFTLEFRIANNRIVAIAYLDETIDEIYTLKNLVQERVQPIVDGMSFLLGKSYIINIEYVATPNGKGIPISPDITTVQRLTDEKDKSEILKKIIGCYFTPGGKPLELALRDFSQTMTNPGETPFYCQRAYDSLLQYFLHEFDIDPEDRDRWDFIWNELGHDNSFITKHIVPKAKDRRHGVDTPITDEMRGKMIRETWVVIDKYIDYMISKYEPELIDIQLAEFPQT